MRRMNKNNYLTPNYEGGKKATYPKIELNIEDTNIKFLIDPYSPNRLHTLVLLPINLYEYNNKDIAITLTSTNLNTAYRRDKIANNLKADDTYSVNEIHFFNYKQKEAFDKASDKDDPYLSSTEIVRPFYGRIVLEIVDEEYEDFDFKPSYMFRPRYPISNDFYTTRIIRTNEDAIDTERHPEYADIPETVLVNPISEEPIQEFKPWYSGCDIYIYLLSLSPELTYKETYYDWF